MNEKILITSALLYANAPLHFGHLAGAYLPADCYARFERMMGNDVLYISGSDEYGVAITLSAEMAKRSPKEHVDEYHRINKELFEKLEVSFDHYSRTSWEGHVAPVQQFFLDLLENGYIEEKICEELYSPQDERFLADRYVVGTCPLCGFDNARGDECPRCGASYETTDLINPRSKLTNAPLERKKTKHWFLLLEKMREPLNKWIEKKEWKPNVVAFVKRYIEELRARSITRDLDWGVPVPLDAAKDKVFYVWFDAPIGYISSSMEWAIMQGDPDRWKDYWLDPKTRLIHFVGKDNIPFHAVIFPAMCMGQNLPLKLVDELPANEFLNLEGRKFSKSDGWTIDIADFLTRYSPDQVRYAIAANAPETQDAEFTFKDFQQRCNVDLVGKLGNLINRTLTLSLRRVGPNIPNRGELMGDDRLFLEEVKRLAKECQDCYQTFRVRRAMQVMMEIAQAGNVYFDLKKPWVLAKDEAKLAELQTCLNCCFECIKTLAVVMTPIMPKSAEKVFRMLGYELPNVRWYEVDKPIKEGQPLGQPELLFSKIEDSQIAEEIARLK